MYSMVITVSITIMYLKVAKRVDPKCSRYKKEMGVT